MGNSRIKVVVESFSMGGVIIGEVICSQYNLKFSKWTCGLNHTVLQPQYQDLSRPQPVPSRMDGEAGRLGQGDRNRIVSRICGNGPRSAGQLLGS